MRRAHVAVLAAMTVAVALIASACGDPNPTIDVAHSAAPSALAQIGILPSDALNGYQAVITSTSVGAGSKPTFDNCGYRFTTEGSRSGQVVTSMEGHGGLITGLWSDVATYRTADDAARAMTELRASVKACSSTIYRPTPWTVVPQSVKTRVVEYANDASGFPAANNYTLFTHLTDRTGGQASMLFMYQQVQNVVGLVYVFQSGPSAVYEAAVSTVETLANRVGARMLAATNSAS